MATPNNDDVIRFYPNENYDTDTIENVKEGFKQAIQNYYRWFDQEVGYLDSVNGGGWKKGRLDIQIVFTPTDDVEDYSS
ncbi:MAG: hypothetical protein WBB28_22295 [Crinalium sp.]